MAVLFRLASVVLLLAAVGLGWLAFTRFDDGPPPPPGSPALREYEDDRMRDALLSVALGIGAAVALVGAFACHDRAGRRATGPDRPEP